MVSPIAVNSDPIPLKSLSTTHLVFSFIALMVLRMAVGYHFFDQGLSKWKAGDFSCEPFLSAARGPMAAYYFSLLDDRDGRLRLCLAAPTDGNPPPRPDLSVTFAIWDDFVAQADQRLQFGDPALLKIIEARRADAAARARSTAAGDAVAGGSAGSSTLDQQVEQDGQALQRLRQQSELAAGILQHHKQQLRQLLTTGPENAPQYHDELIRYFLERQRLEGFHQDGVPRQANSLEVASLREHMDSMRSQSAAAIRPWLSDVELIWDSLEKQINDLAVDLQSQRGPVPLHRHYRQPNSPQATIDRVIPWFDMIVGGLLLVGLFSRMASLAGAALLVGVVASQPIWVPGTQDTSFQILELLALLVIFATCAGRYGGLDWFVHRMTRPQSEEPLPELLP